MKKVKIWLKFICSVLAVVIGLQVPITTIAYASEKDTYLSEVTIQRSSSSKSVYDIKKEMEANGYIVPSNSLSMPMNLNLGTTAGNAVLGYKTTTNRAQAITDINVMNMKGGYKTVDYREIVEKSRSNLNSVATDIKSSCKELKEKYDKGSPAAKSAVELLNLFKVDEDSDRPLGEWLMNPDRTISELSDIMIICNSTVVAFILTQLSVGVADYQSDNWLQTMSQYGEDFYNNLTVQDSEAYRVKTSNVKNAISDFADNYRDAVQKQKEGLITKDSGELVYLLVHEYMNKYEYCGEKIGDYIVKQGENKKLYDELFPMLAAMSNGQCAMLRCGYLTSLVLNMDNKEENYESVKSKVPDIVKQIKSASDDDKISVWVGADKDIYNKEVGLSEEAYRTVVAKNCYDELTKDSETIRDTFKNIILSSLSVTLIAFGSALIVGSAIAFATGIGIFTIGVALFTSALTSMGSFIAAACFFGPVAVAVAAVAVAVVMAIAYFVVWIAEYIDDRTPVYSKIPDVMFDRVDENFIKYTAVKDIGTDDPSDINNWKGRTWNALYTTKDKNAGSPIMADDDGNIFYSKNGEGLIPTGYEALAGFGESEAANLNEGAYYDAANGIYVFYRTEDSILKQKKAEEAAKDDKDDDDVNQGKDAKVDEDMQYLDEIKVFTGSSREEVIANMQVKEYKYFNFDITYSQKGKWTFLGYKTTAKPTKYTIRDIRVTYKSSKENYTFGDNSYGNAGSFGDLTLWYSSMDGAGTPVYANLYFSKDTGVCPKGYEPVNLFSGGNAFDLNYYDEKDSDDYGKCTYLYFLPSTVYTSGEKYISGINFVGGTTTDGISLNSYINQMQLTDFGYDLTKNTDIQGEMRVCYSTTYNPYRAITDVIATQQGSESAYLLPNVAADGISYVACDVFTQGERNYYKNWWDGDYRIMRASRAYNTGIKSEGGLDYCSNNRDGIFHANETGSNKNIGIYNQGLYVSGPSSTKSPLKVGDIKFSESSEEPEGYVRISTADDVYSEKVYNILPNSAYSFGQRKIGLYMFKKGTRKVPSDDGEYISSLSVTTDFTVDTAQTMAALKARSSSGAEILSFNFGGVSDTRVYSGAKIRVHRTDSLSDAITGIKFFIVNNGDKASTPDTIIRRYSTYTKIDVPIRVDDDRVLYVYTTHNTQEGYPIESITIDSNIFNNGQSTITTFNDEYSSDVLDNFSSSISKIEKLTQNDINLAALDYKAPSKYYPYAWSSSPVFFHMTRWNDGNNVYISEIGAACQDTEEACLYSLAAQGFRYYISYNVNYGISGAKPCYIGYNKVRKKDSSSAIRGLAVAPYRNKYFTQYVNSDNKIVSDSQADPDNDKLIGYTPKGCVLVSLSRTTGKDNYCLYYTRDKSAGSPITTVEVGDSALANDEYIRYEKVESDDNVWSWLTGSQYVAKTVKREKLWEYVYDWKCETPIVNEGENRDAGVSDKYLFVHRYDNSVRTTISTDNTASIFSNGNNIFFVALIGAILAGTAICVPIVNSKKKKKNEGGEAQ